MLDDKDGQSENQKAKCDQEESDGDPLFRGQHSIARILQDVAVSLLAVNDHLFRSDAALDYFGDDANVARDHDQKGYVSINDGVKEEEKLPEFLVSVVGIRSDVANSQCCFCYCQISETCIVGLCLMRN